MTEPHTEPIPALAGLVDQSLADKPGWHRAATIAVELWVNDEVGENGSCEVKAAVTQLHQDWHESYRKILAEAVEQSFTNWIDEEWSE